MIVPIVLVLSGCSMIQAKKPDFHKIQTVKLQQIDKLVEDEISAGHIPGAVVCIGQGDQILYKKAYGNKSLVPEKELMKDDDLFDLASCSKPVGTASSILKLMDQGKLHPEDYVKKYLPAFGCNGKEKVKIKHLLTHTSGLPAYTNAQKLKNKHGAICPEELLNTICSMNARSKPGEKYKYSCLGFITLGNIVQAVSGKPLYEFARAELFVPMNMKDSQYFPMDKTIDPDLKKRIVPSEIIEKGQAPICGEVHDPLARLNGGNSGNAGLFSTVDDLAIYMQMLLNDGKINGKQILSPLAVQLLTKPNSEFKRTYGFGLTGPKFWENENAPENSFGHYGWTGTSVMGNHEEKLFIIVLTNRVHPDGKGNTYPVRNKITNVVFDAIKKEHN